MSFRSQIKKHDGQLVVIHLSDGDRLVGRLSASGNGRFFEFKPDDPAEPYRTINTDNVVSISTATAGVARVRRAGKDV